MWVEIVFSASIALDTLRCRHVFISQHVQHINALNINHVLLCDL